MGAVTLSQVSNPDFGESIAFCNGKWIRAKALAWSATDHATTHGAIVVERLRTFGGKPLAVSEHQARMEKGLTLLGIESGRELCEELFGPYLSALIDRNRRAIRASRDVGLVVLVSPGDPGWDARTHYQPSVMMHLMPIPWQRLQTWYAHGCRLKSVKIRNIPSDCIPTELKSRNRLHYFLADREAASHDALPVLLDMAGYVAESSIANILMVRRDGTLVSPRLSQILPGVTLQITLKLGQQLGIPICEEDFGLDALKHATEMVLCGTTGCLWPACSIDGISIGDGLPGAVYQSLLDAWKLYVGLDFVAATL